LKWEKILKDINLSPVFFANISLHGLSFGNRVRELISECKFRFWVQTYVISCNTRRASDPVAAWLRYLVDKFHSSKLDIKFLFDAPKSNRHNFNTNSHFSRFFFSNGIPFRCCSPKSTLHGKIIIVDDYCVIAGSHNWATSSVKNSSELSVEMFDPEIVSYMSRLFESRWEKSVLPKIFHGLDGGLNGSYSESDIR